MKRALVLGTVASLLLAGCGATTTIGYSVAFNVQDPSQRVQLQLMTQHVIERRLENIGEKSPIVTAQISDAGADVVAEVSDPIVGDVLTSQLIEPFDLQIMKEATADKADITVSGHGSFMKTGIEGKHLTWVMAQPQAGGPQAMVTIGFTEEGRTLMKQLFKENKGKFVGIFVRGKLVSKLKVETDELKDDVVIQDIPSYDLASVFADDVNVGLHATFTPKP